MRKDRIRVGVIGVGRLGEFHIQKYKALPGVELVGVMDRDPQRAATIAERYNSRPYDRYEELLAEVEAVSLAAPTEQHFVIGREVLARGVHLLVEKPITYRVADADELIRLAAVKRLVLQVGHVERFNPAVVKMRSRLERPLFIETHRMNPFTPRGTDVDVCLDLMIHDLDIVLHHVPAEIADLHAVGMPVITDKVDIANARIIFENGTAANLTASRVSDRPLRKIRIFQPDAYLAVDCAKREFSTTRLDPAERDPHGFPQITSEKTAFPDTDPLRDQIAAFIEAVHSGTRPVVTGEDGREALKVAIRIIEQIERGARKFERLG